MEREFFETKRLTNNRRHAHRKMHMRVSRKETTRSSYCRQSKSAYVSDKRRDRELQGFNHVVSPTHNTRTELCN